MVRAGLAWSGPGLALVWSGAGPGPGLALVWPWSGPGLALVWSWSGSWSGARSTQQTNSNASDYTLCELYLVRLRWPRMGPHANLVYIYIYTSVLLRIYMHRESGTNYVVDPMVMLIWPKVGITKAITISITKAIQKLS